MKEKLKIIQGLDSELAHKDLSELIERLKNVSEHTSSELSRLGTKSNLRLNLLLRSCFYKNLYQIKVTEYKTNAEKIP